MTFAEAKSVKDWPINWWGVIKRITTVLAVVTPLLGFMNWGASVVSRFTSNVDDFRNSVTSLNNSVASLNTAADNFRKGDQERDAKIDELKDKVETHRLALSRIETLANDTKTQIGKTNDQLGSLMLKLVGKHAVDEASK